METSERWAGWIRFGGILMVIIACADLFQGLIAVIRSDYYAVTPNQIIVFDMTTWGWIMIIWGLILCAAGIGLLTAATWARWFTIVACSLNFFIQLGFVGDAQYPLWALTGLTLTIFVLYAVTVRWSEASETLRRMSETRY